MAMSQESQTTTHIQDVDSHQNTWDVLRILPQTQSTTRDHPISELSNSGSDNAGALPSARDGLLKPTFEALSNKEDMRNPDPTECLL